MRQRLRKAALELYHDQGYDKTTTAQIAERAGTTERTFFRHFPDKREVMFEEDALRALLIDGMAGAPLALGPLAALLWAFRTTEALLEENRASAELRQRIINATPALQERVLTKVATLTNDLAAALRLRGIEERRAILAAQIGMAACGQATIAWQDDPLQSLDVHLDLAFADVRSLFS